MNRQFRNISIAIASGAVLAVAGSVIAEVPDNEWVIIDKDDADVEGYFQADGDTFYADAIVECAPTAGGNTPDGTSIFFESTHPDQVKLKKEKGEVAQQEKDNPADLIIETGSGTAFRQNFLSCKKIEVSSDIKTKKSPSTGSFSGQAKDCVCDDSVENDCADFPAQIAQAAIDCADKKGVKGDFKDGVVKKVKIKGKGDAEID